MATAIEPVRFVDGLVKGTIIAIYDFGRLAIAGLILPFAFRYPRFWSGIVAINERFSSLTYLTLWILLTLSIGLGTGKKVFSSLAGLEKTQDVTVATLLLVTALSAMIVDVLVRAVFWFVNDTEKRERAEAITRIALGNIFLGACLIMLLDRGSWFLPPGFGLINSFHISKENNIYIIYANPILSLFAFSLVIIVLSTFSWKRWNRRATAILAGLLVLIVGPNLLAYSSIGALTLAFFAKLEIFQAADRPKIVQQLTQCRSEGAEVRVSSFLKVEGFNSVPIRAADLIVKYSDLPGGSAKIRPDQPDFVVLDKYTPITLLASFQPTPEATTAPEVSDCTLSLPADPPSGGDPLVQADK